MVTINNQGLWMKEYGNSLSYFYNFSVGLKVFRKKKFTQKKFICSPKYVPFPKFTEPDLYI